jgi:hypothetical protein
MLNFVDTIPWQAVVKITFTVLIITTAVGQDDVRDNTSILG